MEIQTWMLDTGTGNVRDMGMAPLWGNGEFF